MDIADLVDRWFKIWTNGDFENLPLAESFQHTSPYGTFQKKEYIQLIEANRDKFLGNSFEFHDRIITGDKACVRYTVNKDDFTMEVTEWHYAKEGLLDKIIAYYNIEGEISESRKLSDPT